MFSILTTTKRMLFNKHFFCLLTLNEKTVLKYPFAKVSQTFRKRKHEWEKARCILLQKY